MNDNENNDILDPNSCVASELTYLHNIGHALPVIQQELIVQLQPLLSI